MDLRVQVLFDQDDYFLYRIVVRISHQANHLWSAKTISFEPN